MGWFKSIFNPWGVIGDLKEDIRLMGLGYNSTVSAKVEELEKNLTEAEDRRAAEMETASGLVERATQASRKVKYIRIEKQDENSIPYLEEIAKITENECFVFLVSEIRDTLLEELMTVGSEKIEKRISKREDNNNVEIVTITSPEKEIVRIKYMLSGIDFLELAMSQRNRMLRNLRLEASNEKISV